MWSSSIFYTLLLIFGAEWALLPHKSHMSVRIARIDKVTAMFVIQNEIKKKKPALIIR